MKRYPILWLAVFLMVSGLTVYYMSPEKKLSQGILVDKLVVHKSKREMFAYSNGEIVKVYKISLGGQPLGPKQFEGDKKTPEGLYFINDKNPNSGYHKNLGISYPNKMDVDQARKMGKPSGGNVKIHGLRNGTGFIGKFHRWVDWTLGCIAVTDDEVNELYNSVIIGTSIEILP